jgi:hypothetical protein
MYFSGVRIGGKEFSLRHNIYYSVVFEESRAIFNPEARATMIALFI